MNPREKKLAIAMGVLLCGGRPLVVVSMASSIAGGRYRPTSPKPTRCRAVPQESEAARRRGGLVRLAAVVAQCRPAPRTSSCRIRTNCSTRTGWRKTARLRRSLRARAGEDQGNDRGAGDDRRARHSAAGSSISRDFHGRDYLRLDRIKLAAEQKPPVPPPAAPLPARPASPRRAVAVRAAPPPPRAKASATAPRAPC